MIPSTPFTVKPIPTVYFGVGETAKLPAIITSLSSQLLLITGEKSFISTQLYQKMREKLAEDKTEVFHARISDEPTPEDIDKITGRHQDKNIDCVVAIGGGSVLDTGKAVAAMLKENCSIIEVLEDIGSRQPSGKTLPVIAVPTTSGTGSEVTANSVITKAGDNGFKKSLRHVNFIPSIALVDPQLTISCPKYITAACGMDCFTQLVEGFLSINASPFTDSLALEAIKQCYPALTTCYLDLGNIEARTALSYSAFISGIVLTNAGLGTVHGCAPILGSISNIPHGTVCGTLMATANRATLKKLRRLKTDDALHSLNKYTLLGQITSDKTNKSGQYYQDSFIAALESLTEFLKIPALSSLNIPKEQLEIIASKSTNKNNPAWLNEEEILQMLEESY